MNPVDQNIYIFKKPIETAIVCVLGAAVGRFVGESSAYLLSDGISSTKSLINPGGYALAGKQSYYPVSFLNKDYEHCRLTEISPV